MALINLALTDQLPDVVAKQNSNNLYNINNVAYAQTAGYAQHSAGLVGEIKQFAGATYPLGTLWCDGAAYSRTGAQAALFAVIGTIWGAGNGSTTFNVPNLKGRTLFGLDVSQYEFDTLAVTRGAKTHTHGLSVAFAKINSGFAAFMLAAWTSTHTNNLGGLAANVTAETQSIALGGNTDSTSNLPPYAVVNYIIVY